MVKFKRKVNLIFLVIIALLFMVGVLAIKSGNVFVGKLEYDFLGEKINVTSTLKSPIATQNENTYAVNEKQQILATAKDDILTEHKTESLNSEINVTEQGELIANSGRIKQVETNVVRRDLIYIDQSANNFVYNGEYQNFIKSRENISGALVGIKEEAMKVEGALQREPGTYNITITLKDGYTWEDNTTDPYNFPTPFVIKPKPLNLTGLEIIDTEYLYDGTFKEAKINNESLLSQEGIETYYWENDTNGGIYVGIYNVKLVIEVSEYYVQPPALEGKVTILPTTLKADGENLVLKAQIDCINGGFDVGTKLIVKDIENKDSMLFKQPALFDKYVFDGEEIYCSYDISLQDSSGNNLQISTPMTIKLLIPKEIKDKSFRLLNIHNNESVTVVSDVGYDIEGDYLVANVNSLSEFAFVVNNTNYTMEWFVTFGIVLGVLVLFSVCLYLISNHIWKRRSFAIEKSSNMQTSETAQVLEHNNVETSSNDQSKEPSTNHIAGSITASEAVKKERKPRKKRSTPRKRVVRKPTTLGQNLTNTKPLNVETTASVKAVKKTTNSKTKTSSENINSKNTTKTNKQVTNKVAKSKNLKNATNKQKTVAKTNSKK